MCLIIYSATGATTDRETFKNAATHNPDGIGVMSERGIVKWQGPKAERKAWRHVKRLERAGIPHAVHFRWTTHGDNSTDNVHPHATASGAFVMHNGVLSATAHLASSTQGASDTALYVKHYLATVTDFAPVLPLIGGHIGAGNKFVIMDAGMQFHVVNDYSGYWVDNVWYSNDYSLSRALEDKCDALYARTRAYLPATKAKPLGGTSKALLGYWEADDAYDDDLNKLRDEIALEQYGIDSYELLYLSEQACVDDIIDSYAFAEQAEPDAAYGEYSDRAVRS
jgi:hypothetical protein